MGKISPISNKYIIYAKIHVDGVVERPDVIGAVFGQTEGLLGNDLELRELQKSGKIARIDVELKVKQGKTDGDIIIPSSLDKAETAIIAASLETITKIGPCDSKIVVERIEDVRISKRTLLTERAKELLQNLNKDVLPDSREITEKVSESVKTATIISYGKDRLPAGPDLDISEEIILVEGRADVMTLLRNGFKNVLGIGGTSIPDSIKDICKDKIVTIFVDGDRGGDLIIRELTNISKVDFIAKAPDGKEVEELTQKEIHKAIRGKVPFNEYFNKEGIKRERRTVKKSYEDRKEERPVRREFKEREYREDVRPLRIPQNELTKFKTILEELVGTKGAFILDNSLNILGKVPVKELTTTIKSLRTGMYAIILDGVIDKELVYIAERNKIKYLVANSSEVNRARVKIVTQANLQ